MAASAVMTRKAATMLRLAAVATRGLGPGHRDGKGIGQ
jgi:hypothetical protein